MGSRPKPFNLTKKRPQSLVSNTAKAMMVSPNNLGALHESRLLDSYECGNKHQQQQQLKRTRRNELKQLPSRWNVGDSIDCLLDIPLFHASSPVTSLVLECTGGSIKHPISPNQIASKILQFVASISGTGEYNPQTACATIHTMDNVIFTIQLFKTHDRQNVLIEIERKRGNTVQYHYIARAILAILKRMGCESHDNHNEVEPISISTSTHHSIHSRGYEAEIHVRANHDNINIIPTEEDPEKVKFHDAMESISTRLQKDRLDAMILGMESLLSMTNGRSSNATITYLSVKSILQDGMWQAVRDFIFDLIQNSDNHETRPIEEDRKTTLEADHKHLIQQQALEILANCLEFMTRHHSSEMQTILRTDCNDWKEILRSLRLRSNPNNSIEMQKCFQTARCVYYLVSFSVDMRDAASSSNVCEAAFDYQHNVNNQFLNPLFCEMMRLIAEVYSNCK